MRLTTLFTLLFLLAANFIKAQTTITGTVTDTLNKPISSASVYLSKTTYGVFTDEKGLYTLTVDQDGVYEIIVSCVGYVPWSQFISTDGKKQNISIRLSVNLIALKEVSISSKNKNKLADYTQFLKLFLGETYNSEYCKITNPEDLHLKRDNLDGTLIGFSFKPLRIENRSLGYLIIYDLSEFSYNTESGLLRFKGDYYFQTLTGSKNETKRWPKNRLSAYYGSRMHLFRAIFADSVRQENFSIFGCKIDSATNEISEVKPLPDKDLSMLRNNNFISLFHSDPVLISYTDNHAELATGLTGFTSSKVTSTITFSDIINVYKNGYFDNAYSATWGGEMANERIADMLPYDFRIHSPEKTGEKSDPGISPVDKYLLVQQSGYSRDQVFVQTDRNMYSPGDTIYFQAYIRDRFTSQFESKSISLYAVLFDDKQMIIDSSRFKITKSTSSGWMTVPSKAETGKYHFAAFTSVMQNYDPIDAFQLDLYVREKGYNAEKIKVEFDKIIYQPGDTIEAHIKITDAKGEPVVQQKFVCSLTSGNYSLKNDEAHTNRKGESFIRFTIPDTTVFQPGLQVVTRNNLNKPSLVKDFRIPFENQQFELKFLPEGGTLVAGLEQRIGFNATNSKGEPVPFSGLLKNSSGSIIDSIKSGPYGPGFFLCIPEPGMYVQLINREGEEKLWPLPDPVKSGTCLSVKPVDNRSFAVEIQSTGYRGDSVTVSGIINTTLILSQELKLDKKQRIVVKTDKLPSGVAQITLFDKDLKPLAERLFYVNADQHLKFKIKTENDLYHPGEETELAISVTDGTGKPVEGIFSLAITDSLSGHNAEIFTPGIEYTYNYNPAFRGNLPAKVLVNGIENLSNEDRDLLLMVYGWSRYNWDFSPKKETDKELINYDLLNMKIMYALKSHRADRRLDLISLEGPSVKHFLTNNIGEISLPLDSLPEITRSVTMMPDSKNKKIVMGAMLSIPYNEKYLKNNKLFRALPYIPIETYDKPTTDYRISLADSIIEIQQVNITGHPETKKVYHDKYEEEYQYTSVKSLDYELLWSSFTMQDAIRRLYSPYQITNKYIILRPPHSILGGGIPALFVLDGSPLFYEEGWSMVKTISPGSITSLTILTGSRGSTKYGMDAAGGIIFINTHSDDPNLMKIRTRWIMQNKKDNMLIPINIYRPYKEFYNPTKFDVENDPAIQSRSTILWKSEVYFNGKEPVRIKYNNLKHYGPVIITINGVSFNNLVGTGRAGYLVN